MSNVADHFPAFKFGAKVYPQNMISALTPVEGGNVWFVDGDKSGSGAGGRTWEDAFTESDFNGNISTLGVVAGDVVYVAGRTMAATDTDPISYTTNLVINVPQVSLIGVSRGRTQGGLPQLKVGATTTSPIIEIKAPGVMIANIGINGAGVTGGGVWIGSAGGAWQGLLAGNKFYKNVGDFVVAGTSGSVPQDIVLEDNIFSSPAASVDVPVITSG